MMEERIEDLFNKRYSNKNLLKEIIKKCKNKTEFQRNPLLLCIKNNIVNAY